MGWILDLAFFLILILGTAYGAYRGFVAGICKMASTLVALIFAFTLCVAFSNFLELCFGMTTALSNALAQSIAKNELYAVGIPVDASGATIGAMLGDINGIARWFISTSFKSVELIPAGTTPAILIGSVLAKWISIVISFVALVILIKLGAVLITKLFDALKDKMTPVRIVDQALGAVLGLLKAVLLIFILLLIMNWLPIGALHDYISSSAVVGRIFTSGWFQNATSYAISGKWFSDYIGKLLK